MTCCRVMTICISDIGHRTSETDMQVILYSVQCCYAVHWTDNKFSSTNSNINISQDSATKHLRCDGVFNHHFIAMAYFLDHSVYCVWLTCCFSVKILYFMNHEGCTQRQAQGHAAAKICWVGHTTRQLHWNLSSGLAAIILAWRPLLFVNFLLHFYRISHWLFKDNVYRYVCKVTTEQDL